MCLVKRQNAVIVYERVKDLQAKIQALQVEIQGKDRQTQEVEAQLKLRAEQQDQTRSQREYDTIQLQIEMDKKKFDRLSEETLTALETLDRFQAEVKEQTLIFQKARQAFEQEKASFTQLEQQLTSELKTAQQKLAEQEKGLPRQLIAHYELARRTYHGEDAFATIQDEQYCSGCNCSLPPQTIAQVQVSAAGSCPRCRRLLYNPRALR